MSAGRRTVKAAGLILRDGYRIAREGCGQISCARIQVRALQPLTVQSERFDCGAAGGSASGELALTLLADYLHASRIPEAYAHPLGAEIVVWELHRRFQARFLTPLRLGAGEAWELSAEQLEEWLIAEAPSLSHLE